MPADLMPAVPKNQAAMILAQHGADIHGGRRAGDIGDAGVAMHSGRTRPKLCNAELQAGRGLSDVTIEVGKVGPSSDGVDRTERRPRTRSGIENVNDACSNSSGRRGGGRISLKFEIETNVVTRSR